jgi:exodeoxyribonuclease VII small subunit
MADESHGFAQTRARLEDIVAQVRKKDTSLETSLDLLEEGVRLANQCTELIDHADWEAAEGLTPSDEEGVGEGAQAAPAPVAQADGTGVVGAERAAGLQAEDDSRGSDDDGSGGTAAAE